MAQLVKRAYKYRFYPTPEQGAGVRPQRESSRAGDRR
ncbi:helix-turn-helix domain-containing protein [Nonomuraea angiospora]